MIQTSTNTLTYSEPTYPTLAKERETIRFKEGHVRAKKKQDVQDHHDDLGEDLSGLGGDLDAHASDLIIQQTDEDSVSEAEPEASMQGLMLWCFLGHPPSRTTLNVMAVSPTAHLLEVHWRR